MIWSIRNIDAMYSIGLLVYQHGSEHAPVARSRRHRRLIDITHTVCVGRFNVFAFTVCDAISMNTWPQCGVRYRWPGHSAWTTTESLLDQRYSTFVVPLVLNRPDSVNQCKRFSVSLQCGCLQRRTTRKRSRCMQSNSFVYTEDVVPVFNRNSVVQHIIMYADDKQLYSATTVNDIDTTRERLVNCILDVRVWCASRRPQKNRTGVV